MCCKFLYHLCWNSSRQTSVLNLTSIDNCVVFKSWEPSTCQTESVIVDSQSLQFWFVQFLTAKRVGVGTQADRHPCSIWLALIIFFFNHENLQIVRKAHHSWFSVSPVTFNFSLQEVVKKYKTLADKQWEYRNIEISKS